MPLERSQNKLVQRTFDYQSSLSRMAGLTVDECLDKVGSFGRYQIRLVLILSLVEWVNIGFQVMLLAFVAAEPPWVCVNNATCPLKGELKPGMDGYKLRCDLNRSDWKFTDDFTSVVTEFDLVCDNTFLASLTSSVIFAGWLVASLASGVLSDKIGRKPVLIVFAFFSSFFALIAAFPKVYWLFTLCRLLVGIGIGGCGMPLFVIATEFVGVRQRHIAGTIVWFFWTLSLMSLSGIAYLIRDWRTLSIICAAPGLTVFAAWWFVPESTRYLILKGKLKEAEDIMRKIAQTNKKEYPTEPLSDPTEQGKQNLGDFRDLFRTKRMIHRTLVSWYSWFVTALVYYGVSFASPSLGGNMYFNFFLTSIVEFPANYAAIYGMGKCGRKKSLVGGLIVASFASIGSVIITMKDPGNNDGFYAGQIIMAMTAKFFVTVSFDVIYVYAAELFPTVVRNVGMGSSTAAARVGSFSAPYIVSLNRIHPLLPFGIMAAKAMLAGLLCMTLPETKGMPTEETMGGDAPLAADNVAVMSDLEDKDRKLVDEGNQDRDEEKSSGQGQTANGKVMQNGDAALAAENAVAVDEVGDGKKNPKEQEKNERKDEDAPLAADNPVSTADEEENTEKKNENGEQTDSEVENTAF